MAIGGSAPVVKSIFAKIGTWFATSKIAKALSWAVTAITVGAGIKGFREAQDLMAKGQGILGQKTAQGGKIPVIYGRRRVGSTLALMHTHDGRSQNLVAVYMLAVGEVEQIELDTIEINGVSIKDRKVFHQGYYAGSDKIASGAGSLCTASQIGVVQEDNEGESGTDPTRRYRMVFNAHHGADDQVADPMLIASTPEVWSSNHRLRGIAYIAASFEYDTEGMFRSMPQLTVVVRGRKIYDPRKDGSITGGSGSHRYDTPSTYEWSDNAALCLLDYLRNDEYGKGLASSAINLQSFQTAANTSDTIKETPDYDGTASAATFTGSINDRFLNVDATTWGRAKIGGLLTLEDSGSNTELDAVTIVDALRFHEFDETNPVYQLVVDGQLSANYTNENGTALVKVKRFHCNGLIDTNKNVLENTQELLANMRGILNYIDGKYEITLEDTASSAFTVTDDHIIASTGITVNYEDKSAKANKVVVQFFNALKRYEMDTVTVFHDPNSDDDFSDYKSDDGGEELELVVDFPHIVNKYVAYNMGKAILGRTRNQMTITFTATPELYKVKVGDVITVAYTPLGFTGKLFRIEGMNLMPNGLIDIQAIEYLDIYTWEAPPQENIEDIARIPTGREVKAPSGLSFTDTDSSSTGRAFLSWSEMNDYPNYEFRVSIVDSSGNKLMNRIVSDNFVDLTFLPVGSNYVASVTTINGQGSESSATTLTFTVGDEPVLSTDIKDNAITTSKLIADAVTNAKLAVNSIQGDVIAAGAITESKLLDGSVATDKLAANAVTAAKITANTITASQIASGTLTSASGVFGAISAVDITAGTLNANRLNIDNVTLDTSGDTLIIKSNGVGTTQIATRAAGAFNVNGASGTSSFGDGRSSDNYNNLSTMSFTSSEAGTYVIVGNCMVGGTFNTLTQLESRIIVGSTTVAEYLSPVGGSAIQPVVLAGKITLAANTSYTVSLQGQVVADNTTPSVGGFSTRISAFKLAKGQ